MYEYCVKAQIADMVESVHDMLFEIDLKENMNFLLSDCYFTIKKNHNHDVTESDSLVIRYYQEREDESNAKNKLQKALDYFVFLTGFPYELDCRIIKNDCANYPVIDVNLSKRKMLEINKAESAYKRIQVKKKLLEDALRLFDVGTRMNYIFGDSNYEDSFFAFFKIVEIIVKDDFKIEEIGIDRGKIITQKYVEDILKKAYAIETTTDRYNEICGKMSKVLFKAVFEDMYHKIIWYLKKNKIRVDYEEISDMVFLRNKIAHGEIVDLNMYKKTYKYTVYIARNVILTKFFSAKMPGKIHGNIKTI